MKTLAEVLAQHRFLGWFGIPDDPADDDSPTTAYPLCVKCGRCDDWPAHAAAAWRTERTITTAMALSHLPAGAIARDKSGDTWLHYPNGWDNLSEDGTAGSYNDSALEPPVYVLFVPGEEQ